MLRLIRITRALPGPTTVKRSIATLNTTGPWPCTDFLSPTQAEQLDAALEEYLPVGRHSRLIGENVPPGYHLIFFNPKNKETSLSSDGYESFQAPAGNFPNRMWVGGSVTFNLETMLRFGVPSQGTERLADLKQSEKDGFQRVSVSIERQLKNVEDATHAWAVREMRTLTYFSDGALDRKGVLSRVLKPPREATYKHALTPSALLLFRYSALTFNSHKIHIDRNYAIEHEGLPDLVVQGPLTVTLMLRWISTTVLGRYPNAQIKSFNYKNLLPMFVDRKLTLCAHEINGKQFNVWIEDDRGSMTMSGTITLDTNPL